MDKKYKSKKVKLTTTILKGVVAGILLSSIISCDKHGNFVLSNPAPAPAPTPAPTPMPTPPPTAP